MMGSADLTFYLALVLKQCLRNRHVLPQVLEQAMMARPPSGGDQLTLKDAAMVLMGVVTVKLISCLMETLTGKSMRSMWQNDGSRSCWGSHEPALNRMPLQTLCQGPPRTLSDSSLSPEAVSFVLLYKII
eukprot:scaffold142033_cov31-Prasinocladus_malaysianus.AAC.1